VVENTQVICIPGNGTNQGAIARASG